MIKINESKPSYFLSDLPYSSKFQRTILPTTNRKRIPI